VGSAEPGDFEIRGAPTPAWAPPLASLTRLASLVLSGATPLQGGVPIYFHGKTIGAIRVSGNSPQEDEEIALAGAAVAEATLKSPPP